MNADACATRAIHAVVLAAGESRRFGATKQLAELGGEPLVHRAARLARACCGARSVLVVGHDAAGVRDAAAGLCPVVLENLAYRAGIGTSIALAARHLRDAADAMLLLLADQVRVEHSDLARVIAAWSGDADEIVASAYAGTRGPPVLLPRNTFPALALLAGDRGARGLFDDPRFRLRTVTCAAAAVDVDTRLDFEALE